jgi:hypothetical protein
MFDVAAEADLLWELGRLCRSTAIEAMKHRLTRGEFLFLNVDPHDFVDPEFSQLDAEVADPTRVVIEITERTAIKDYPKFRERLKALPRARLSLSPWTTRGAATRAGLDREPRAGLHQARHLAHQLHRHELHQAEPRRDDGALRERPGAKVIAEGVERPRSTRRCKGWACTWCRDSSCTGRRKMRCRGRRAKHPWSMRGTSRASAELTANGGNSRTAPNSERLEPQTARNPKGRDPRRRRSQKAPIPKAGEFLRAKTSRRFRRPGFRGVRDRRCSGSAVFGIQRSLGFGAVSRLRRQGPAPFVVRSLFDESGHELP